MAMKNHKAAEVIDALGGTAAVAKLLDMRSNAISNMKVRGIPPLKLRLLKLIGKAKLKNIDDIDSAATYQSKRQ